MTAAELDRIMAKPVWDRVVNPWLCAWNMRADDGIGDYEGTGWRQCPTKVSDPTKARYCFSHSQALGIDFYSPPETAEVIARETSGNLTRLVPKAVQTLEDVMNDKDAPAGIRAKSASDVLDRTGYARGVDVRVDGQVNVIDVTAIINERLDALREAKLRHPAGGGMVTLPPIDVVESAVVDETGGDDTDRPA